MLATTGTSAIPSSSSVSFPTGIKLLQVQGLLQVLVANRHQLLQALVVVAKLD